MLPQSASLLLVAVALASSPALAGERYVVTIQGEVEFNGIPNGPLGAVTPGEAATISFEIDDAVFVNSGSFPTRGYVIDPSTWTYTFDSASAPLADPFPVGQTPYFVIRNDDPAVDGFMLSLDVDAPQPLPLDIPGAFGPFGATWYVTYGDDPLPSLDIADAVGTYDFTGLTVFNFLIEDGPFEPFGVLFESLTIAPAAGDAWSDQGHALAGTFGDPALDGSGDLSAGSANAVDLTRARRLSVAALFLAPASTPVPFKGGTLVPVPFVAPILLTTSGTGTISIPFVAPGDLPPGAELWVQFAIQDPAAVNGVALSNAILGLTP